MKLSLIIPCYNEEQNIKKLIEKLNSIIPKIDDCEIILINNGSQDNTYYELKTLCSHHSKYKIINIEKNYGYGNGIYEGIKFSSGDIIAWTHADLQTDPEDIVTGYNLIKNESNKVILKGKRKNRSIVDVIFTNLMSKVVNLYSKSNLSDINAQPKFFHRHFVEYINNPPKDFNLDLYTLIKAIRNGYEIKEFPVFFHNRYYGVSKGGGSIKGKFKLSYRTLMYIIFKSGDI